MTVREKAIWGAILFGKALLIVIGWCVIMAFYFVTYAQIEGNAVPVMVPTMSFTPEMWNDGYFSAKGSWENSSATEPGDRMILGTVDVSCNKSSNTCTVSSADVFDSYLNLDVTHYDIDTWDDRFITFHDDSSICANDAFVIDRNGRTVNLAARKKTKIPDYALKSSLHPCDGKIDKNVTLVDGFKVWEQERHDFEGKNAIYFHAFLFVLNAAYFVFAWWFIRRKRKSKDAHMMPKTESEASPQA